MSKRQLRWLRLAGLALTAVAAASSILALHLTVTGLLVLCAAGSVVGLLVAMSAWAVDRTRHADWRRG